MVNDVFGNEVMLGYCGWFELESAGRVSQQGTESVPQKL